MFNAPPSTDPSAKQDALARRLGGKSKDTTKDKVESPEDQKKIAAARKIIAEQQQIIYDLQHNGK